MKINLDKVSYDGKWEPHGDGKLKIRPYPSSRSEIAFRDGVVIMSGESGLDMFTYCLEQWEGITDAVGQPLALTEAVKKQIFDFQLGQVTEPDGSLVSISNRVLTVARRMSREIEADVKN
jgi:hypothetical protein